MINVERTIISQYSASPTLKALISNINECVDPRANLKAFYNAVWNIDTAVGFGLDIWGKIVGIDRLLRIPANVEVIGFVNASVPPDWQPFNQGAWFNGQNATQSYFLPDDVYRTLILTKALSNIVTTSASSINRLLRNLFPGRGRCYVVDLGGMAMQYVFEFALTTAEYAILTQSGALPHPAGVEYSVVVIPTGSFGFFEAGSSVYPFDYGTFYLPAS